MVDQVFFISIVLKFGAMHFIYYINRSIATKVDSTYLGYDQRHNAYMSCGESWARTRDV